MLNVPGPLANMLWVKSFHIIFMVTWFSGLFYLPRIFVYHAMSEDAGEQETFKVMERKLMIMTHLGAVLTIAFGTWLLLGWAAVLLTQTWMLMKLGLVVILILYHLQCYRYMMDFRHERNRHSHRWYRLFNEIPVLFLVGTVLLVVLKPGW